MAHMIEEHDMMFSVRQLPWHGLGKVIEEAPDSEAAIKIAQLDWTVQQTKVYTESGIHIPDYYANIRSDTGKALGMVTGRYSIVQNKEAFAFTDSLIGGGHARYETAGSLRNGRTVWMLARLEDGGRFNLLGDEVTPYICFTNTHDGTGSVRVMITPVRVVCNNTLNLAVKGAHRAWSTTHVGDIQGKLHEAERTLTGAEKYLTKLEETADVLEQIRLTADKVAEILHTVLPYDKKATARQNATMEAKRDGILKCLQADDIRKFAGSGFALVNAVSDYVGHAAPMRSTSTFAENRFAGIITGNTLLDQVTALVQAAA